MKLAQKLLALLESAGMVYTPGVDTAPYSNDAPRGNLAQKKIVANDKIMRAKDIKDRTTTPDDDKYAIVRNPDIHGQTRPLNTHTIVGGIP